MKPPETKIIFMRIVNMKNLLVTFALLQFVVAPIATAQLIPVEIDLSRQKPVYPFLPPNMPTQITSVE